MPKIFEYFGLIFLFHADDHAPIHVHVRYAEFENKVVFDYKSGKIIKVKFIKKAGKLPLPVAKQKIVEKFIKAFNVKIAEKWMQFYVLHKKPVNEKITKKI